jgi:uncharacterized protein involved in exopolysaccharide biosynthesis
MRDFFRIWFYWKNQAALIFILIVGVVMLFSYAYTPVYQSSAKILLLPRTSEGLIISAGTDETRVTPVSTQDLNTEIELLTNEEVIRETVRSFQKRGMGLKSQNKPWLAKIGGGAKKALNEFLIFFKLKNRISSFDANVMHLRGALKIEPVAMSNVIYVTLRSEQPKAASVVLDRLLAIYIKHHNEVFSKEGGIEFYQERSTDYGKKLDLAEKRLKAFQQKWNIIDLKSQNESNIRLLADLSQKLNDIEISNDEAQSSISMLRRSLNENKKDIFITKEMRTIPAIVELEKGLVPLLIKRSEILKSFTPSSREYRSIQNQIEILREEIKKEIVKAIKTDEFELENLKIKQASLQKKIETLQQDAISLNQKERMLNNLERELELHKNNYILYANKTEDARIYSERKKRNLANVSIANKASVPVKPVFPNKFLMLFISVFVGFFAALGTPFILEFLDHRIKTSHDVEYHLSLPVICALSETKN